jgi:hypothetical protein
MVKYRMVVLTSREKTMWLIFMWLWAECCNLLLEHWWVRGGEKADVVWTGLR